MTCDSAATFLFADIAGFTALTEAHGDEEAVELVEDFARAVQKQLPQVDGEYVKAVGDALMLRIPDPGDAIRLGLWITRNAMSGHQAPSVRVGGHYGSAVERSGDYFGTTINIAARVFGPRSRRRAPCCRYHSRARPRPRQSALRIARAASPAQHC